MVLGSQNSGQQVLIISATERKAHLFSLCTFVFVLFVTLFEITFSCELQ